MKWPRVRIVQSPYDGWSMKCIMIDGHFYMFYESLYAADGMELIYPPDEDSTAS